MNREELPNNRVRLSSPYGILDIRDNNVYSEVICSIRFERFFIENIQEGE